MTAFVDHSRDHDLTESGRQAACGWALHHLAIEKHRMTGDSLPRLSWVISDLRPRLFGTAFGATEQERAAKVHAWATHLGVEPVERQSGDQLVIEVDAIAHGVTVHINTRLRSAKEAAA